MENGDRPDFFWDSLFSIRPIFLISLSALVAPMASQVNNPVILLDEIDKLTRNAMFNPSGAMLELLDPEQNHTFKDGRWLEISADFPMKRYEKWIWKWVCLKIGYIPNEIAI